MMGGLLRFRTGLRALAGVERQLERLARLYEADLAYRGVIVPESGPAEEAVVSYTDEEVDYVREVRQKMGQVRDDE